MQHTGNDTLVTVLENACSHATSRARYYCICNTALPYSPSETGRAQLQANVTPSLSKPSGDAAAGLAAFLLRQQGEARTDRRRSLPATRGPERQRRDGERQRRRQRREAAPAPHAGLSVQRSGASPEGADGWPCRRREPGAERFPPPTNLSPRAPMPKASGRPRHRRSSGSPAPPRGRGSGAAAGPGGAAPPRPGPAAAPAPPGTNKEVSALSPPAAAAAGTYRGRARPACWRCRGRTCPPRAGSSPGSPPRSSSETSTWPGRGRNGHREAGGGEPAGGGPRPEGPRAASERARPRRSAGGSRPVPSRPAPPPPSGTMTGMPTALPRPGGGSGPPLPPGRLTARCCGGAAAGGTAAGGTAGGSGRLPAATRACHAPPRHAPSHRLRPPRPPSRAGAPRPSSGKRRRFPAPSKAGRPPERFRPRLGRRRASQRASSAQARWPLAAGAGGRFAGQ